MAAPEFAIAEERLAAALDYLLEVLVAHLTSSFRVLCTAPEQRYPISPHVAT